MTAITATLGVTLPGTSPIPTGDSGPLATAAAAGRQDERAP